MLRRNERHVRGSALAVHFVTEQRLRVHGGGHVERLVIVIRTFDGHETRVRVGADRLEEVGEAHAPEVAGAVPPFHTDMSRVLRHLRQSLNLRQRIVSRFCTESVTLESTCRNPRRGRRRRSR